MISGISAYSVNSGQMSSVDRAEQSSVVRNNQKPVEEQSVKLQDDIEDTATISDEALSLLARDKEKAAQSDAIPVEKVVQQDEAKAYKVPESAKGDELRNETYTDKQTENDKLPAEKQTRADEAKTAELNTEKVKSDSADEVEKAPEKTAENDKLPAEKKSDADETKTAELNSEKVKVESSTVEEKPVAKTQKEDDTEKTQDEPKDNATPKSEAELSEQERQQIQELKARDAEVKAHEQAHISAAVGINASAPSYDYQTGPDGKKYAVGGEVSISFSSSGDPNEDIQNAETMRNAALAPTEPSSQDRAVAKNAEKIMQEAREKLAAQQEQQKEQVTNAVTNENVNANASAVQNLVGLR